MATGIGGRAGRDCWAVLECLMAGQDSLNCGDCRRGVKSSDGPVGAPGRVLMRENRRKWREIREKIESVKICQKLIGGWYGSSNKRQPDWSMSRIKCRT